MYCNNCGSEMLPNGTCPICGQQAYNGQTPYRQTYQNNRNNNQAYNQALNNQQPYYNNNPAYGQTVNNQQPYYNNNPDYGQPVNNQQPYYNNNPAYGQPVNNQQPYYNNSPAYGQPVNNQQPYYNNNPAYGQPVSNQQTYYSNSQTMNGQQNMSLQEPAKRASAQQKKKRWPVIVGIIAGVFAIGTTSVVLLSKHKKDNNKGKTPTTTEYVQTTEKTTETTTEITTEEIVLGKEGSKTIMVYMVGSNLESDYYSASDDLEEMMSSGYNDDNINILIYTGGAYEWHTTGIPDDENACFLIKDGELQELYREGERNMGDSYVLADFLNYGYENYPAEQYGVIFWNHGGGCIMGYGYDEKTCDLLSLSELKNAFDMTAFQENNKLEFIGFDACLMATIETADVLSPYANYMIASQESEPGWGWDYSFLSDIDGMTNGADIGTTIVDHYISTTESNFEINFFSYSDITLSVLDLDKVDEVEEALNAMFSRAYLDLDDRSFAKFSRIRSTTKELCTMSTGEESYDLVDLGNLAEKMKTEYPDEASTLTTAVNDLVVYSDSNETNVNGVSIYYPYNAKSCANYYISIYYGFDFATDYTTYIDNFSTLLNGDTAVTSSWDPATLIPTLNADGTFSLQLDDAQAADVQNVYFAISRADVEQPGKFIFVSLNNEVEMSESNNLTAMFDGNITYMMNNVTYDVYEIMYQVEEETMDYTRYLISAILYNEDINEDTAMYCYFLMERTPENPQGVLLGVYPISDLMTDENMASMFPEKFEINLDDYTFVAFGCLSHEFTSEEDLTYFNEADWSDVDIWYNSMLISDGFSTVLQGMIPEIPYYGMFIIEDTQGNRHASNLVQIQ